MTNSENLPRKFNTLYTKENILRAIKECIQILLTAIMIAVIVQFLSVQPYAFAKAYATLSHEFDAHAKKGRALFPVFALFIAFLPIFFMGDKSFEHWLRKFAASSMKFLAHLTLAAIGFGVTSIYVSPNIGVTLLFIFGWFLISVFLMLLANGYSEPLEYKEKQATTIKVVAGLICLIGIVYVVPVFNEIELIVK